MSPKIVHTPRVLNSETHAEDTSKIPLDVFCNSGPRDTFHALTWERMIFFGTVLLCGIVVIAFLSASKSVAIIAMVGCVVLSFARPDLALLFIAAYIPLEPFALKFVPADLYVFARYFSEGLIYILFLSLAWRVVQGKVRLRMAPLLIPVLLLTGVAVVSILINGVPPLVGALGFRQIVRFILVFFLVYCFDFGAQFFRRMVVVVAALALFESALGILQALLGGAIDSFLLPGGQKFFGDIQLTSGTAQFWEGGQRVFATMGRYDQLGTFLSFVLLGAAGFFYQGFFKKAFPFLIFFLGALALVLTYSRASWFGFLLGLFVIGALIVRDRRVSFAYAAIAGALGLYLIVSWVAVSHLVDTPRQTAATRFLEAFSYERWRGEYRGLGRMYFMLHTPLDVVARSPVFGFGPGTYGGGAAAALHYTKTYDTADIPFGIYGSEGYIDNNWFSLWGELGTAGLALYIWMFVIVFRRAHEVYRKSADPFMRSCALGFLGIVAAVSLQGFLATYFEMRTLAFYFWLFGGLIAAEEYRNNVDRNRGYVLTNSESDR